MNLNLIKMGVALLATAAIAGTAGYQWARATYQPKLIQIAGTACGIPAETATFAFPLEGALHSIGSVPIAVGPVDLPDGGGPITLRFDPSVDGQSREITMVEDVVHLPTAYGRNARVPEQITITCRDGAIASVRYRADRQASATFKVLHEQATLVSGTSETGEAITMSD